ncbi:MAG: iron ABC transporter permease [Clostridiales bacterium]|nr:iron ABC transporter permease [Clostridiales bacterium]
MKKEIGIPIRDRFGKASIFLFFAWFIIVCLVIPNVNVLYNTFFGDGHFSMEPINKLLSSEKAMRSLKNSFILAPTLSVTVGFIGLSLVLITEYFDIKGAKILRLGFMSTLVYGGIILVSGYKFIYGQNGYLTNFLARFFPNMNTNWFEGYWAVLFVMTFACTSNHIIFLRNAIRQVDYQTIEAAKNLGASSFTVLVRVVLPVLRPSMYAVTILTFLTGLSATSAPLLVGGPQFQTITPMILTFSKSPYSRDLAALLSIVLAAATIILLVVMTRIEKRGYYMSISKVKTRIEKQKIDNRFLNILMHIYAYVLFLIYTIPVILVIMFSFTDAKTIAQRKLSLSSFTLSNYTNLLTQTSGYKPFAVSIIYSVLAAFLVGVIITFASRLIHKYKGKLVSILEYSLLIPWILPSTLIAIGLVITYDTQHWYMFNKVLIGTSFIMLLAYIIVKLPFTLRMTKAAFFALDDNLEDASKNLGASGFYTFRRVLLPIIMPSVLAIFALNFNSLLSDYDLSVFLYHPMYQPLGVYIKSLTDSTTNADNTALTFVYAVILMIISATVLYLVYGRGSKDEA